MKGPSQTGAAHARVLTAGMDESQAGNRWRQRVVPINLPVSSIFLRCHRNLAAMQALSVRPAAAPVARRSSVSVRCQAQAPKPVSSYYGLMLRS